MLHATTLTVSTVFHSKPRCHATWLHWRRQDALLVLKHFVAHFHPKPNECLRFDLESCTYTVVTHPCHIPPLAQARPMMLCIYTSYVHYE